MINVDIAINDSIWKKEHRLIAGKIKSLIKQIIPETELKEYLDHNIEISILLTNDQEITELNQNYRNKNNPTNVLSFPAIDFKKIKKNKNYLTNIQKQLGAILLGDIILAYQTIHQESILQNKKFFHHLSHLIVHSLLHLIGYDHVKEKDAVIMENLEIDLLKKLDIANPYLI